jgi:hypothetical protein
MPPQMLNDIEKAQLASATIQCFSGLDGNLGIFPSLLKKVIEEKVWQRRVHHGRTYELPNLHALITRKPLEGWGEDPKKIEAIIKDNAEVLAMYREEMTEGAGRPSELISNNITNKGSITGTSRAYSIARVKKDCEPETVAEVLAGKISPNAALVRSGIRVNRQIFLSQNSAQTAAKIFQKMGEQYALQLSESLRTQTK